MPVVKFFVRLDLNQICLFLDEHYFTVLILIGDQYVQRFSIPIHHRP